MTPRTLSEVVKQFMGQALTDRTLRELGYAVETFMRRCVDNGSVRGYTPVQVVLFGATAVDVSFSVELDNCTIPAKNWDTLLTAVYEKYPGCHVLGLHKKADGSWYVRVSEDQPLTVSMENPT